MKNGFTRVLASIAVCVAVPSIAYPQSQIPGTQAGVPGEASTSSGSEVQVIATVNGEPIAKQEFERAAQQKVATAKQTAAQRGQPLGPQEIAQLESTVLDSLIEGRLVEAYAISKVNVPEQQVQQTIEQVEQQLAQQQVRLDQYVSSQGQTMDSFKKRIEGSIAWQGLQQQELSPEKIQQFYQENQQAFPGDNFEAVQPQVAQAYAGVVWDQIVKEMKPKVKIEKKAGRVPQQNLKQAPAGGLPAVGNGL